MNANTLDGERIAQLIAHRVCLGVEHDPEHGKLHGYCVVCGVPWPCDYAGQPPTTASAPEGPWEVTLRGIGQWSVTKCGDPASTIFTMSEAIAVRDALNRLDAQQEG